MNRTTSLALTSFSMNFSMLMILSCVVRGARLPVVSVTLAPGDAGLQCQGMQLAAHLGLKRLVDDLVLLHPGLAAKRLGHHGGRVMVAVAGKIANRDLGVRDARLDQPLDLVRIHRHGSGLLKVPRQASTSELRIPATGS